MKDELHRGCKKVAYFIRLLLKDCWAEVRSVELNKTLILYFTLKLRQMRLKNGLKV